VNGTSKTKEDWRASMKLLYLSLFNGIWIVLATATSAYFFGFEILWPLFGVGAVLPGALVTAKMAELSVRREGDDW